MSVSLRSNDGDSEVVLELGTRVEYGCELGVETAVNLRGRFWDGDHTFPTSAVIEGLGLSVANLQKLQTFVAGWVSLPLSQLTPDKLIGRFELCALPGQRLSFKFGPRNDTISSGKPVISVEFSAGSFSGSFHFLTDQSCLKIFATALSAGLASSLRD